MAEIEVSHYHLARHSTGLGTLNLKGELAVTDYPFKKKRHHIRVKGVGGGGAQPELSSCPLRMGDKLEKTRFTYKTN